MSPAGFEASERPQTYALNRAATGIGSMLIHISNNIQTTEPYKAEPLSIKVITPFPVYADLTGQNPSESYIKPTKCPPPNHCRVYMYKNSP